MSNIIRGIRTSRKQQKLLGIIVRWIIAILLIIFAVFPIYIILLASLDPAGTLATQTLLPENASIDNYRELFTSDLLNFQTWFLNSLKIATITTIFSVSITTLAAYSFSRFRFRQRSNMLRGILLIQVFPGILAMVAVFLLIVQIGEQIPGLGLNSHSSLILVYLGGRHGHQYLVDEGVL